jgi:hypothetical protein
VQQHNDCPSIYRDHLERYGEGLQHVGALVDDVEAVLEANDWRGRVIQGGSTTVGQRFAYVDVGAHPGAMLELIETTPAARSAFEYMKTPPANGLGPPDSSTETQAEAQALACSYLDDTDLDPAIDYPRRKTPLGVFAEGPKRRRIDDQTTAPCKGQMTRTPRSRPSDNRAVPWVQRLSRREPRPWCDTAVDLGH